MTVSIWADAAVWGFLSSGAFNHHAIVQQYAGAAILHPRMGVLALLTALCLCEEV